MIDIVNLSVFLAYTVIVAVLLVFCFKLRIEYKKTYALLVQSVFDKEELLKKFEEFVNDQSVKAIEETDGFVRFISQSRDWAFEYIEDVQKAIQVLSETPRSNRAQYNEAYKRVLSFIPDETIKN
jgi:hypothetical protein